MLLLTVLLMILFAIIVEFNVSFLFEMTILLGDRVLIHKKLEMRSYSNLMRAIHLSINFEFLILN